ASQEDQTLLYSQLIDALGMPADQQGAHEQLESLLQKLHDTPYDLPELKLKLSNGASTKFVDYHQVSQEDEEWQVVGYLVADKGSGFDHQLLGMMGASTKGEVQSKRGGLGEGLKMSVAQLN